MYCKYCKKQFSEVSSYCPHCGKKIYEQSSISDKKVTSSSGNGSKWWLIGIIVLVAAIVIPKISENNTLDEKFISVLQENTDKAIVAIISDDYDSDGKHEAFAIVGKGDKSADEPEYYDADIWFVNETEAQPIKMSVSGHSNGIIEFNSKKYISLEFYEETKSYGFSYIYTVVESKPVESDTSGKYSDVHQDGNKILAKNEISDDYTEIYISSITSPLSGYIEVSDNDIENLNEFLSYLAPNLKSFSSADNSVENVYQYFEGFTGTKIYNFFFDETYTTYKANGYNESSRKYTYTKEDPLGKFSSFYTSYIQYSAKDIDWIVENIFNITPDHSISLESCYYYGDYYYSAYGDRGITLPTFKTQYSVNSDDTYTVNATGYYDDGSVMCELEANVALKLIKGKRYWSILEIFSLSPSTSGSDKPFVPVEPSTEITTRPITTKPSTVQPNPQSDLKSLYRNVFNYYEQAISDLEKDGFIFSYAFHDINEDGVTDMIVECGSCEMDRSQKFFTISQGEAIELGTFSSWHTILFDANGKIVALSGTGGEWYTYDIKISNGIVTKTKNQTYNTPEPPNLGTTIQFNSF